MYTATPKQQEDSTYKDSHPKCFITTNLINSTAKLSPRAMNRGEILRACFRHFPPCFHFNFFASITIKLILKYLNKTLFNMQIVNKKGEKDSLCKTSHAKCFRTKIFDRVHQGMSRRHLFRIPPAKFRIQFICNIQFLVVCFYLHSDIWKYPALVLYG